MQTTNIKCRLSICISSASLQSLSTNNPLILVDGIERDITDVTPEEVETVTILKDAAAVAIYGNKGINGVVNINGLFVDKLCKPRI